MTTTKENAPAADQGALENNATQPKSSTRPQRYFVLFRTRHSRHEYRYLRSPVSKAFAEETVARLNKLGIDARAEQEARS